MFISALNNILATIPKNKGSKMQDTTDPLDLTIRTVVLLVIVGIFYFVLKSKKEDKK